MKAKKVLSLLNSPLGDGGKVLLLILLVLLASCKAGPYINHDLKSEKIGDCSPAETSVSMTENTNGEHYEFNYCLVDNFSDDDYAVDRTGDTIVLSFPKEQNNETKALYKLDLDIHANPRYNYIKLGTKVLQLNAIGN